MPKAPLTASERLRRKGQGWRPSSNGKDSGIANLIVIGTSAGGHSALIEVLGALTADIPAALVILLHMPIQLPHVLGNWLARFTRFPLVAVEQCERLRHGVAFIPPPGRSVSLRDGRIRVVSDRRSGRITTINRLFTSAAKEYGPRVIGVILTGLLRDGTEGLKAVHEAGGLTVVQNPKDAQFGDMPANAMRNIPVTFCLNLKDIGPALDLLARRGSQLETGMAVSIRVLKERIALLGRLIDQSWQNAETYQFLVQELAALQKDFRSIRSLLRKILSKESAQRRRVSGRAQGRDGGLMVMGRRERKK